MTYRGRTGCLKESWSGWVNNWQTRAVNIPRNKGLFIIRKGHSSPPLQKKNISWDGPHLSWVTCFQRCFLLKEHPSISHTFLPVGWQDSGAANTQDYPLFMAKGRGDFIASWAFPIHKVGIGSLPQVLFLVFPLLERAEGNPLQEDVLVGRLSPPKRKKGHFFRRVWYMQSLWT